MIDVSKLPRHILLDLRQRLSAGEEESRDVIDKNIAALTPLEAVREWCGWKLGSPDWADTIINVYESAKAAEIEKEVTYEPKPRPTVAP